MQIFNNANFDFIRWRWHALALSLLVVVAGLVLMVTRGMPLGIDFTGGTMVIVQFNEAVAVERVRDAVASIPGDEVVLRYDEESKNQVMVRLPLAEGMEAEGSEQGTNLELQARQVLDALNAAGLPAFTEVQRDAVGPSIGAELQRKGIYSVLTALIAITIYIGFRFRFSFAAGAIAATLHDVLVTLAFLVFFKYDLSLNVVAAILTITGYSVNDTIVIFDRVRENLRARRRDPLDEVVNRSVNQTLARTVITAGTTLLSVTALFLFGGEALEAFAFTMIVGIASGTYSTVFIASSIAILLSGRKGSAVGGAAAADTPTPDSKKAKRAKAS